MFSYFFCITQLTYLLLGESSLCSAFLSCKRQALNSPSQDNDLNVVVGLSKAFNVPPLIMFFTVV